MKFYNKNEKTNEEVGLKEEIIKDEEMENAEKDIENKEIKVDSNIEKNNTNDKNKKILYISIISISILLILIIICTGFALININNTKIMSGVSINGISVQKLTQEEAESKMAEVVDENLNKDIIFKIEDFEYSIKLSQLEVEYNIQDAVHNAYEIGREGNIFSNNFRILKTMIKGEDINLEFTYNEKLLEDIVNDMAAKVPDAVINSDYYIEDDKLIITKGKAGNSIDKENVKNIIIDIIKNNDKQEIQLDVIKVEPDEIDIDKIYNEVYTEPQDAYYTKDPFEIFSHVNGVDFDIEAAKEALKEDKEEYEIPLIITEPEITTDEIGTEAFPDLLSSFSTRYDASKTDRTTNLKLAMNKLDGVVVSPGETFSYNKTLGKRTAEAGYKEAGGYAGGRVVQTLAGGICQISSTLYDAVVYANLEIVERHNHMFLAGYVGAGKDATVVYGALDFKFKNTRNYPIMIKTSIGSGVAKIDIYGIKEDVEYDVEISTKILSYIPYSVIYEEDSSLAAGKEKVVQSGMNGCKSITYKILKLNGQQVSSTVLSTDTYDPMNKIIKRGPTEVATSTSTEKNNVDKEETNSNKEEADTNTETKPTENNNVKNETANEKIDNSTTQNNNKNNVNNT